MEENIELKAWFVEEELSEGTQEQYTRALEKYEKFTGKTLDELIKEAEIEEDSISRIKHRSIKKHIIGFKSMLQDKYSPSTVKSNLAAIMSFYKGQEIEIPNIKLPKGDINLESNKGQLLTKDEIRKMISYANPRDKAIIYFLALSGTSGNETRELSVKRFMDSASKAIDKPLNNLNMLFENKESILNEVLVLDMRRKKNSYDYQTFIPPEASKIIIDYLDWRKNHRNDKVHVKDLNEPLFVTKSGTKMSKTGIGSTIKRLGYLAGLQSESGSYCYWRPHAFRKYLISTIINETKNRVLADYIVGHKIDKTTRAYWFIDIEALKKDYMEALPALSIDETNVRTIESDEYQRIKADNQAKDIEMAKIKKQIEIIEQLIHNSEFMNEYEELKCSM